MTKPNPALEALTLAVNRCIAEGAPVYKSQPAPKFIIKDWAGNVCFRGKEFPSFEEAWKKVQGVK